MENKIETFYTGGGITLAEADIGQNRYAVVSSDAPDFLSVYVYSEGETTYLPEDMISCTPKEEITAELKALFGQMLDKLKTA
jgi:hypothetical protein